jgi:general secretion pathway protein D
MNFVFNGRRLILNILFFCAIAGMGGCAQKHDSEPVKVVKKKQNSDYTKALHEGMEALKNGNSKEAVEIFNGAISIAPTNARLHFLLALAYHIDFLNGNYGSAQLAETGYTVAAQLEPGFLPVNLQLARFYIDTNRPADAKTTLLKTLEMDSGSSEVAFELANASYMARDIKTAAKAILLAHKLEPENLRILQSGVIICTAANLKSESEKMLDALSKNPSISAESLKNTKERMQQWQKLSSANVGVQKTVQGDSNISQQAAIPSIMYMGDSKPLSTHWADCTQNAPKSDDGGGRYDSGKNDADILAAAAKLQALPSPCAGKPLPRMTIIDAAIILADDSTYQSRGINLLDSLQTVFSWSDIITKTTTNGLASTERVRKSGIGLPDGGIAYSLNIANNQNYHNHLLARPSLVALDRQPATFFSGASVTVSVSGQVSGGDLVEKPIGIGLSVTPTFVDDETLLLAVKITRSSVGLNDAPGDFNESMHVYKSGVSTSVLMKLNQTLILSGLIEKENETGASATPVMENIPVAGYLFGNKTKQNIQKSLLIVITPRKAAASSGKQQITDTDEAQNVALQRHIFKEIILPTEFEQYTIDYNSERFVSYFKKDDVRIADWTETARIEKLLKSAVAINFD